MVEITLDFNLCKKCFFFQMGDANMAHARLRAE